MHSLATFALAAALLCQAAHAHFTITGPVPSREKQAYPSDNRRFWPIAGGATLRPEKDCLQFPRGQVASLAAGQALTVPFEIGNNARHVGMCTASLINLSSGAQTDLGQELNCVHDHDAMQLTLPQQSCANCVIKIKVTAVHLGPDHPEFYDSCLDVNVGGGGASDDTPAPSRPYPPPAAPPADASPAPTPEPAAAPVAPAAPADSAPVAPTTPENQTPLSPAKNVGTTAPASGSDACTAGAFSCGADGNTVRQCAFGQWQDFAVPAGTMCSTELTGYPAIVHRQ